MQNQEQRSPYEKLELSNRQKPEAKTSKSAKLSKLLQTAWQNVSAFMTSKSEHTQQSNDWGNTHGWKQRTYAYLPAIEEERDWLEKIYHQSNR